MKPHHMYPWMKCSDCGHFMVEIKTNKGGGLKGYTEVCGRLSSNRLRIRTQMDRQCCDGFVLRRVGRDFPEYVRRTM